MTRNASEVAAITDLPYLRSVASGDNLSKDYLSMKYLSYEEFATKLISYRESIVISKENPLEVVSIVERDSAGYVRNIQVGSTLIEPMDYLNYE